MFPWHKVCFILFMLLMCDFFLFGCFKIKLVKKMNLCVKEHVDTDFVGFALCFPFIVFFVVYIFMLIHDCHIERHEGVVEASHLLPPCLVFEPYLSHSLVIFVFYFLFSIAHVSQPPCPEFNTLLAHFSSFFVCNFSIFSTFGFISFYIF